MEVKGQLQVPSTLSQEKEIRHPLNMGLGPSKKKKISYPFRDSEQDF
jgi:hypothetical protein